LHFAFLPSVNPSFLLTSLFDFYTFSRLPTPHSLKHFPILRQQSSFRLTSDLCTTNQQHSHNNKITMRTSTNTILATAAFAAIAFARTDLEGCTSTDVSSPAGASIAWYVPGTGEVCEILDCGGGRAPAKTTVPGCAAYSGTASYSPSYLAGFQASATSAPSTTAEAQTSSESEESSSSSSFDWDSLVSQADTSISSWDLYTTTASSNIAEVTSSIAMITSSPAVASSSVSAVAAESTLVAQTTAAGNTYSNGTVSSSHAGTNGTVGNGTASPSAPINDSGAADLMSAWVGSASLMAGLAAVVAFL
jgi:hypothetical protein